MKYGKRVLVSLWCTLLSATSVYADLSDPRIGERAHVLSGVTSPTQEIKRIFFIGDSLSDSDSRMHSQSHGLVPPTDLYWQGHLTNGPTWNQYLASALQAPSYSYALAGARIYDVNNYYVIPPTLKLLWADGAHQQINQMDKDKIWFNETDLVGIWIGGNDYLLYPNADKVEELVMHTENLLTRLRKRGASRFVLLNIPDVTKTPFHALKVADIIMPAKKLRPIVMEHNRLLANMVSEYRQKFPNIKLTYVDTFAAITELYNRRLDFDLDVVKNPCIGGEFLPKGLGADFLYAKHFPQVQCRNPEQHFYWDPWHPTTKVHCLTAVKVLEAMHADQATSDFSTEDAARRCLTR